ncbi:hypothetical protein A2U01_0080722, partial [Trifolium medium]|nr:hypothetical protein [Trifolium medium]
VSGSVAPPLGTGRHGGPAAEIFMFLKNIEEQEEQG